MRECDAIVAITTFSITHTRAREDATKAGARIASMLGFTVEMFEPEGAMAVDYNEVARITLRLARKPSGRREVKL